MTLTAEDVAHALHLARRAAAEFAGRSGRYGDNRLVGHVVGKLGESAAAKRLTELGYFVDRAFLDPALLREADLTLQKGHEGQTPVRVEVKSWQRGDFARFGGNVAATQFAAVVDKSDVVVWVELPTIEEVAFLDRFRSVRAQLAGWSSTADLVASGVACWEPGMRANLHVARELWRPLHALADELVLDPLPAPSSAAPDCGHERRHGKCWGCAAPPPRKRWPGAPRDLPRIPLPEYVDLHRGPGGDGRFHLVDVRHGEDWAGAVPGPVEVVRVPPATAAVTLPACSRCFPRH